MKWQSADVERLRAVPITGLLEQLGFMPKRCRGTEYWYCSPLRDERNASFKVDTQRNVWFDFGIGKGGDIFRLAGELIGNTDFKKQLEFLSEKSGVLPVLNLREREKVPNVSCFEDVKIKELHRKALTDYLRGRGIAPFIAMRFCKEIEYRIRCKWYFAIGFMNRSGGYELRNPMFKGCISPKDISCIRLSGEEQDTCCVFEGFADFLSAVVLRVVTDEDCLVLNSVSNLERSHDVLDKYGTVRCYLDRDPAGKAAFEILVERYGKKVSDCSGMYEGNKDLNEYLTRKRKNE